MEAVQSPDHGIDGGRRRPRKEVINAPERSSMSFGSGRLAGLSCALVLPAVVSLALMSQKPAAAAPAAALGPEGEVGEPANGYVGRLDVSPAHAPAGTPVTLSAAGLPPGQAFQPVWNTATGARTVTEAEHRRRPFTPVAYEIAKAKIDQSGRLAVNFVAPDDYGVMHDIVLQQGSRLFTHVEFKL